MSSRRVERAKGLLARMPLADAVRVVEDEMAALHERLQRRQPARLGVRRPRRCGRCYRFVGQPPCRSCGWVG